MTLETAARLAALRRTAGLSQEGLAEKLGVSRQAVSKWERGEACPDIDNLIALSDLYGVSLDGLVRGTMPDTPPASDHAPEPEPVPCPEPQGMVPPPSGNGAKGKSRRMGAAWLLEYPLTNLGVSALFLLVWAGIFIWYRVVGTDNNYWSYGSDFFAINKMFRLGNYAACIFLFPWLYRLLHSATREKSLYKPWDSSAGKFFKAFPYAVIILLIDQFAMTYGHSCWWLLFFTIPLYEWMVHSIFDRPSRYQIALSFPISGLTLCVSCFLSICFGVLWPYWLLVAVPVYYGIVVTVWAFQRRIPIAGME